MLKGVFLATDNNLTNSYERLRKWVLNSRRDSRTWIVTLGHVLKPPFNVQRKLVDDLLQINISGSNESFDFSLNSLVDSEFRHELGLFLIDNQGALTESCIIAPFSRHLQVILEAFPPGSRFTTEELYAKVTWGEDATRAQAHARRRWKELKYDYGFDLDWDGMYWRGSSEVPIRQPNLRPNDNKIRERYWSYLAEESSRINKDDFPHCAYCGIKVIYRGEDYDDTEPVSMGLIDHRRPVFQGGNDTIQNLQILCQTCNNIKNSTCRHCPYSFRCDRCEWAYPEKTDSKRVILHLDQDLLDKLLAHSTGSSVELTAIDILKRELNK